MPPSPLLCLPLGGFCLCCPKGWLAQCPLLAAAQSCPLEWQGMGCRSCFACRPARHPMGPAPGSLLLVQPLRDQTATTFQLLDQGADCSGAAPWRSPGGPVYREVFWHKRGFIPCVFSARSWRALCAQQRSCEHRSRVPRWGGSRTQPRAHPTCVLQPLDLPSTLAMLATFTCYLVLLSPTLTPDGGHQLLPGERDGVLFPSSLWPSG